MKSIKFNKILVIAVIAPFLWACPKAKTVVPPEPDMELQSAIDVSFATFVISDIDMMCSFAGESDYTPDFYTKSPQSSTDLGCYRNGDRITVGFNNTNCLDGRLRGGSVLMDIDNTNPNATYYHRYQFSGAITLSDYKVDGWLIKVVNGVPARISNQLSSPVFDPAVTKLSWVIEGSFEFTHPTDPERNMIWTGKLIKTLANTNDLAVYSPSKQVAINWALANVEYSGNATGYTTSNAPFKMEINSYKPLTRDFTCSPDVLGGITNTQPLKTWNSEFHPFKNGIVSFTSGSAYPRQIYYGNEVEAQIPAPEEQLPAQCDNKGIVLIKGISYPVDFMK